MRKITATISGIVTMVQSGESTSEVIIDSGEKGKVQLVYCFFDEVVDHLIKENDEVVITGDYEAFNNPYSDKRCDFTEWIEHAKQVKP